MIHLYNFKYVNCIKGLNFKICSYILKNNRKKYKYHQISQSKKCDQLSNVPCKNILIIIYQAIKHLKLIRFSISCICKL